jgi:proline iminopeptidase
MRRQALALCFTVLSVNGCARQDTDAPAAALAPVEGAFLARPGGDLWYRVTGDGPGTPVILLHGGPGFSSFYLKPLEALGDDRPVIRYDQLGSGRSDPLTDTATFTIERFVAELDALRAHLGLERFHLYGHSWGTMLATEYYRVHPEQVASLVLGSAALDARAWEGHTRELLQTLPDSMIEAVELREAEGNYSAPDYQAAMEEFYARYVWRRPVAADLDSLMTTFNTDLYGYMWGPSEFTVTGTLQDFDAKPMLGTITVPVLYTVGEFDEAGPENIEAFARLTPGARVVVIPDAGHITAWDNPDADLAAVRDFLREADGGS